MKPKELLREAARRILGEELYSRLRLRSLQLRSNRKAFGEIYERNLWGSDESVSGAGSSLELSYAVRVALPALLTELNATSLLDAGCGDVNWINTVDLAAISYLGVDVVEPLIARNNRLYGSADKTFLCADITRDRLPAADVVLCRHCFIHLSNRQVRMALRNFKAAGAKFLVATTSPEVTHNVDTWPGSFRLLDLEKPPFNLGQPARMLHDSGGNDASPQLGVWCFAELDLD
jgi:SAM-dependent methyltransferase